MKSENENVAASFPDQDIMIVFNHRDAAGKTRLKENIRVKLLPMNYNAF